MKSTSSINLIELPPLKAPLNITKAITPLNNNENLENEKTEAEKKHTFSKNVTPEKLTETNEKSTEDQSVAGMNFKNKFNQKPSKSESKSEVQKFPIFPKRDMESDIRGFNGVISLLPLNCEKHKEEYIKYFCREDDCKFGLCPE